MITVKVKNCVYNLFDIIHCLVCSWIFFEWFKDNNTHARYLYKDPHFVFYARDKYYKLFLLLAYVSDIAHNTKCTVQDYLLKLQLFDPSELKQITVDMHNTDFIVHTNLIFRARTRLAGSNPCELLRLQFNTKLLSASIIVKSVTLKNFKMFRQSHIYSKSV